MWLDGCPGIEHGEAVIILVDDRVGMISAGGFHGGWSWSSLIYSGISFASKKNYGKPPSQ
jgi:hypothetical protein